MQLILTVVHVLVALSLIFVVLLQKSSGSDMGAAFGGGGGAQSVFGARGSGSFMGKLTAGLATVFMLTSLSLAFLSTGGGKSGSIMEGAKARQEAPANPAADKGAPVPAKESADAAPADDGMPVVPKSGE